MESMLNKLKSTVTKVTADVTSAVMGNPVTREFEVGRHIASGGPGLSWRIYNGTKKSTKQVCVCVCQCLSLTRPPLDTSLDLIQVHK